MRDKNRLAENIDILGDRWKLVPSGKDIVEKCQQHVWDIHTELSGYGALFRNLNNCDFTPDELYGVSIYLIRISKRLRRVHDLLDQATSKSEK